MALSGARVPITQPKTIELVTSGDEFNWNRPMRVAVGIVYCGVSQSQKHTIYHFRQYFPYLDGGIGAASVAAF